MATLDTLKEALRQQAQSMSAGPTQPLSESQYSEGFESFHGGTMNYKDFIIPQLSQLMTELSQTRSTISVLEIGPGPKSVLGQLSLHLRRQVSEYTALEPNSIFASALEGWISAPTGEQRPLPGLKRLPAIHETSFSYDALGEWHHIFGDKREKFDLILFCHSMYGMPRKAVVLRQALTLLVEEPQEGMIAVFHRAGDLLHDDSLTCSRTATFSPGSIHVANQRAELDKFAPFIAGSVMRDANVDKAVRVAWHKVCLDLARHKGTSLDTLVFSNPETMVVFNHQALATRELPDLGLPVSKTRIVKNREACLHHPASVVGPRSVLHVQECVRWALKHRLSLTVVGGGHSGHCVWPNVVAVDMKAFDKIHVLQSMEAEMLPNLKHDPEFLVVAEAGCTAGDIIRSTAAAGLTVPLGSRPSVGAGLWLQGGIGHLSRFYGLTSDAIIGAVVVSVETGEVLCLGCVPSKCRPSDVIRPKNEAELLWGIKGAASNIGVVISVTFKAFPAPMCSLRTWVVPLADDQNAQSRLKEFNRNVAQGPPYDICSTDAYLFWESGQLHLGVTMFVVESAATSFGSETCSTYSMSSDEHSFQSLHDGSGIVSSKLEVARRLWGPEKSHRVVDTMGMFSGDLYMSELHGGHGGGKTSSFKRCIFIKDIGEKDIAMLLVAAVRSRPSPTCYLHLLQGGGAIQSPLSHETAFGCREWGFACVITGVWPREQDGSELAREVVNWVYMVAYELARRGVGVYGADLGPGPRDTPLAACAFGSNRSRLIQLKKSSDPHNVLAYACPLPAVSTSPKAVFLVTGEHGVGKDYCAGVWEAMLEKARTVSISDELKREYAIAKGADLSRLLEDRAYKEHHRLALTRYFEEKLQEEPNLRKHHFVKTVQDATGVEVLFITGMRDEAPVKTLWHLVPDTRLLEIIIDVSSETRHSRIGGGPSDLEFTRSRLRDSAGLSFNNNEDGPKAAKRFAHGYLLPLLDEDLQKLATLVPQVADFPRTGIMFRHVLDIAQKPGGLKLCTSLLWKYCTAKTRGFDALVCCEAGGFVFASALSVEHDIRLVLIRDAGKLPPPTISIVKTPSHVSFSQPEKVVEMDRDALRRGQLVLVVDDVLATGNTLCAVLQLLQETGVESGSISVMVVAEFPYHRGRELLRQRGFGKVRIESLLVFDGA